MKTTLNERGFREVEPEEVWNHRKDLLIVDVRSQDEFLGELGHVPGSKLMVLDELPQTIFTLPKDKPVVFVCRSGSRSGHATLLATENGFDEVYNMMGGMILWNQENLETSNCNE